MMIDLFYIFAPTPNWEKATVEADEEWLSEASIWSTKWTVRAGAEIDLKEVEEAFWAVFTKRLSLMDEAPSTIKLRELAAELKFEGCWKSLKTNNCDPAQSIIDDAASIDD